MCLKGLKRFMMVKLIRDEVKALAGPAGDLSVAAILDVGASPGELAGAMEWIGAMKPCSMMVARSREGGSGDCSKS